MKTTRHSLALMCSMIAAGLLAAVDVSQANHANAPSSPAIKGKKATWVAAHQEGPWTMDLSATTLTNLEGMNLNVLATQSGTWSVTLNPAIDNNVKVVNPQTMPALVRDVRERQAFHLNEVVALNDSPACAPGVVDEIGVVSIPSGVRAVIEQVTAQVKGVIADILPNEVGTTGRLGGISAAIQTINFDPTQNPFAPNTVDHFLALVTESPFVKSVETRIYADSDFNDATKDVQIVLENLSDHNLCGAGVVAEFSASGYLEACSADALPITCPVGP